MDFLEFLAHSEWPLVISGAVLMFRQPIRELIDRISVTKVDAWAFKAEFERMLDKVDVLTPSNSKHGNQNGLHISSRSGNKSPESVILQGWNRLDSAVRRLAVEAGKQEKFMNRSVPLPSVAKQLELDPDGVDSIMLLLKLRNDVAHATALPLSSDDAERFSDAVERILFYLKDKTATAGFGLMPPGPSAD